MSPLPAAAHAAGQRQAKAARNAAARARRRARVVDWTPRSLRCQGCGRWTAPEAVEGYGGGRVWCEPCALAADVRRVLVRALRGAGRRTGRAAA